MLAPKPFAESTCPKCQYRRPLSSRQYEALYAQVWTCPGCGNAYPVMDTTRCVM